MTTRIESILEALCQGLAEKLNPETWLKHSYAVALSRIGGHKSQQAGASETFCCI